MNDKLVLSIFTAVEGAHAFSAFMPSYFTVQKFAGDPGDIARLRSGYVPAIAFNVILGGSVSAIIRSPLPLVIAGLVSVGMVSLYEGAISKLGANAPASNLEVYSINE